MTARGALIAADFDLARTVECGQFFGWSRAERGYFIVSGPAVFRVAQSSDRLEFEGVGEAFIRHFFSLEVDLGPLRALADEDPRLRPALEGRRGLRLIRQDPWECLVSFLCSPASNLRRIGRNVEEIRRRFGRRVEVFGREFFLFPRPGEIGDAARMAEVRAGFRARHILAASRAVREGRLERLRGLTLEAARAELVRLDGVGDKVADCVLAFSLGHGEAFPLDVWVRRAMKRLYFRGRRASDARIRAFARARWGPLSALVQQHLFDWIRTESPGMPRAGPRP
jgi:N-glycosylase/DNA lyase